MQKIITADAWKIIENNFDPKEHQVSESIFSIGNGRMGQRGMFEETYTGIGLSGSYLAGVYYPDKTRVGWWKNGYPEYFAKVLNSVNWQEIKIEINGVELDLMVQKPTRFQRVLDMRNGVLERTFRVEIIPGVIIEVHAQRFCSMERRDIGILRYELRLVKSNAKITLRSGLNAKVFNQDANYNELFWDDFASVVEQASGFVTATTKKTNFKMVAAVSHHLYNQNGVDMHGTISAASEHEVSEQFNFHAVEGDCFVLEKMVAITTSFFYPGDDLQSIAAAELNQAVTAGWEELKQEHNHWWHNKWDEADIMIIGDNDAQQGIRYNIFQLNQTYTGEHPLLNIGPKGFTGEKYGGSTYWDTEAYCIPFYLSTADSHIAKNLLLYRFQHLSKAIENAGKLGFSGGAALYPMVTMNGEECHNEWEITFEEIHRNGAIAYAIYDYTNYTGDESYVLNEGLEVLVAIARFWKQRITFSEAKGKYVMLGVTGPNEYENNVNNNWYTNYIAIWCLKYCQYWLQILNERNPEGYNLLVAKLNIKEPEEVDSWQQIIDNMYFPAIEEEKLFLQQDGYMDKEQILVSEIDPSNLPLHKKWSWDRILRSCFIKQADVLQGLYLFEDDFDADTHRANFDFYEPRTVHESSLSPCVHAILAARNGYFDKAYEMYMRTARLDLDNYNKDTEDGLHITSMAGTWMAVVKGIGGMKVRKGVLHFAPFIPVQWESYKFSVNFRGIKMKIFVNAHDIIIDNYSDKKVEIFLYGERIIIPDGDIYNYARKSLLA